MPKTAAQYVEEWHAEWLTNSGEPHWGIKIDWATAEEIAYRLDQTTAPEPESCERVTGSLVCTRQAGHEGACTIVTRDF